MLRTGTVAEEGLLCSNYYLSVNPIDSDSDGNLNTCTIEPKSVDVLTDDEEKQLKNWLGMARAAGWDTTEP